MPTTKTTKINKIADAMQSVLTNLGHDLEDDNFQDTPTRFAKFMLEFSNPLTPTRIEEILGATFPAKPGFHSVVAQSNIPFRALCAHHLAPMLGRAAIGYIPNEKVVGLSKMTRLVEAVGTETPGIQEGFCERVADLMMDYLKPAGVIVVMKAEHGCMACRGVAQSGIQTTTSTVRGIFRDNAVVRNEFLTLIGGEL